MKHLRIEEAAAFLLERDRFVILTHKKPDGDTVGSAVALCLALRKAGKQAHVMANPQLTDNYLPFVDQLLKDGPQEGDCIVSVDIAGREMLGKGMEHLQPEILFDHHGSNQGFAPCGIVRGELGACAELIYELVLALGVPLDKKIAEALYLGTATDTGCFRFANTTEHTLLVAAACKAAGADTYPINRVFFETIRLSRLRLEGYMVEHMELYRQGTVALCRIPLEVEQSLGVEEDDMGNLSSFLRNIQGVEVAVTFRTAEDGSTKLSVRATPAFDAAAICVALGGGGHKGAAGATVYCCQAEAKARTVAVLKELGYIE